jgi:hypothetical protein
MTKNRSLFLVLTLFVVTAAAVSQSNEQIDAILAEETATLGSAAYLALSAAGEVDDGATAADAVGTAQERGWLPPDVSAEDPASFGQFAYMMMEASDVSGGLMYLIFPGPRYAAREFVYQRWSPENIAPGEMITGQLMVRLAGNFAQQVED